VNAKLLVAASLQLTQPPGEEEQEKNAEDAAHCFRP
jgi:hypothetical protein